MSDSFGKHAHNHLKWACGVRGWSPADFWQLTPREVQLAWHGWCESLGIVPEHGVTRTDLHKLITLFPDAPHG